MADPEKKEKWYKLSINAVLDKLDTDPAQGISETEAKKRILQYGLNELLDKGGRSVFMILWEQLSATMVAILIAAAIISLLLGGYKDAIAISAIVILFVILGFIQEYRAERAIIALRKLAIPSVKVFRSGKLEEISARELVPGDILQLEVGNIVPADCRLIESINLKIQESALTGESVPIEKHASDIENDELSIGDRKNMAYRGTIVTQGRGTAVITETGMNTELGKIATLIQTVKTEQTPLQKRLDHLGKILAIIGVSVSVIIIAIGWALGENLATLIFTGISVAVAVIPEGLPAVVTITLAIGAQRMLKRNALIRKLPAVETLGSVNIICSDKTGTLTQNKMTVVMISTAKKQIDLREGIIKEDKKASREEINKISASFPLLLTGGTLCNDAKLLTDEISGAYKTIGDPTEIALVMAANNFDLVKETLEDVLPRVAEIPFDSDRKRMTTIHKVDSEVVISKIGDLKIKGFNYISFTKGAVDKLMGISDKVFINGVEKNLTPEMKKKIIKENESWAKDGMRILGLAYKKIDSVGKKIEMSEIEKSLTFVGSFAMIDPPREEVKDSVALCKKAGIRPIMITGDHPLTAKYIAKELGILGDGEIITGDKLEKISVEELKKSIDKISVYARVSPEHKLKIVQALQEKGYVVAMTGDGVNDAPALKKADIGVSMGITGTDVAKEASDTVLLDDNFATIVASVEEGRTIYDNIRKFVKFSIAGNIGKVMVMLFAPLIERTIPLLPLQLLWLNLLTDGFLGLGLGMEKAEKDLMSRKPFSPKDSMLSHGVGRQIFMTGILIGIISLAVGGFYFYSDKSNWQTMIFVTLAFCQIWQVIAVRSSRDSFFSIPLFSNLLLVGMVALVFILQIGAVYFRPLSGFLRTVPLSGFDFMVCVVLSSFVFMAIELDKRMIRRKEMV